MMIEHIALYVNDLEAARTFFMKYLGASSNDGYHTPNGVPCGRCRNDMIKP